MEDMLEDMLPTIPGHYTDCDGDEWKLTKHGVWKIKADGSYTKPTTLTKPEDYLPMTPKSTNGQTAPKTPSLPTIPGTYRDVDGDEWKLTENGTWVWKRTNEKDFHDNALNPSNFLPMTPIGQYVTDIHDVKPNDTAFFKNDPHGYKVMDNADDDTGCSLRVDVEGTMLDNVYNAAPGLWMKDSAFTHAINPIEHAETETK